MTDDGTGTVTSLPPSPGGRPPDPVGIGFRGDIDGLRAVAIVVIVGYHMGLGFLPGGFIGVDVFFVISGYLITRNLLTESATTGRVALLRFWGRRIRRLVPALALMIVVVLALSIAVLSSLQWQEVASQGRAAALYVSNIVFASQATDYFAQDISSSLFLHTWSLGVEEQFYIVWPLLVAGAAVATARRRTLLRPLLIAAFTLTLVVSFALSVVLTGQGSAHAFFGLPSRAWEFAAAGLLATLPLPRALRHRWVATVVAIVGAVLIAGALVGLGSGTEYPGAWPIIPVAGTLLLIAAGTTPRTASDGHATNVISRLLDTAPFRAIGRVSYSWYLWHWPLILLAVAAFDRDDLWITGGAALVALAIGTITYVIVENPVRRSTRLARSLPRTYVLGVVITAVAVVATFGLNRYSTVELDQIAASSTAAPTVSLADVRASKKDFRCLEDARTESGIEYCLDGDPDGDRTIVVIGDSHARHWKPAFAEAARQQNIRLVLRWRSVCTAFPIRTVKVDGSGEDIECQEFRADTLQLIGELEPDAVVTSNSDDYGLLVIGNQPAIDQAQRTALWREAYEELARSVRASGMAFGSVVDTPRMPADPLDCVAERGIDACAVPRDTALGVGQDYSDAERSVREELGRVPVLDINAALCDERVCPVVIDGRYVYTDLDHLHDQFVLTQVPAVRQFFDELLSR